MNNSVQQSHYDSSRHMRYNFILCILKIYFQCIAMKIHLVFLFFPNSMEKVTG